MTFSIYIKFHVLNFFCKYSIIRGSYNTQSRNNIVENMCWFQINITTIWVGIKELYNANSKLSVHLKTPAHFKMGTTQHYFRKFLFTGGHYHISRYVLGTFGKQANN